MKILSKLDFPEQRKSYLPNYHTMRKLIKKHYSIPHANKDILAAVLENQKNAKEKFSPLMLVAIFFVCFLLILFTKYMLSFNISYFDISSTMISSISTPLFLLWNILISLTVFIYTHMLMLLGLTLLWFISSFSSIMKRS